MAGLTFFNSHTCKTENIYDQTALDYINTLCDKSPEKAMDMADRLKKTASESDDCKFPRDWNYVMYIYNNDYSFIDEYFWDRSSLSEIEALHHAKDEISDKNEFLKYRQIPTRLIYPLLDMRKEYPEQVNKILDNETYKQLFACETEKVSYTDEMREFAEFIKDDIVLYKNIIGKESLRDLIIMKWILL